VKPPKILFILVVLAILAIPVGVAIYFWRLKDNEPKIVSSENIVAGPASDSELEKTEDDQKKTTEAASSFDTSAIQAVVDSWSSSLPGGSMASVVILDSNGEEVSALNPDDKYFSASLYKLFVAYAGYQQIDTKVAVPDEMYTQGFTRAECLDLMIRESHSPCAEKMWNELGKAELTTLVRSYGIENTDLVNLQTTARDTGKILERILNRENLSPESQSLFLDSMKTQDDKYRNGLPSGFSDEITVYNKVGWNEQQEYHDAAIIELADGRKLIVAALTSGVGTANLRKLATAIEEVL